ncbi:MAG: prenyltransferase/squalene oxidase repeat-containing protein [Thermoguttaceae bacterium]
MSFKPLSLFLLLIVMLQSVQMVGTVCADNEVEQERERERGSEPTKGQIDETVRKGVQFLLSRQNVDGSFGKSGEQYFADCGVAALCGLALLAEGSTPESGIGAECLQKIISFLLGQSQENGMIGQSTTRGMYGHGFATQFLAECYGMNLGDSAEYRAKLRQAVDLIIRTQNREIQDGPIGGEGAKGGGWRYRPICETVADVSVSITQIMALRSAKNAGLYVPSEVIDRAIIFLNACRNEDGGFRYMLTDGRSGFARSAGAVAALQSAGEYRAESLKKMFAYLEESGFPAQMPAYYHYGHYYAAIAVSVAGPDCPISWKKWYSTIAKSLIAEQEENGSWRAKKGEMPVDCTTAMSLFILCVPRKKIPLLFSVPPHHVTE